MNALSSLSTGEQSMHEIKSAPVAFGHQTSSKPLNYKRFPSKLRRVLIGTSAVVAVSLSATGTAFGQCGQNSLSDSDAIVLNQMGWQRGGPMRATIHSDSETPVTWKVLDAASQVVATGTTLPFGEDTAAGRSGHRVVADGLPALGEGFALEVCGTRSHDFTIETAPYSELADDTLRYFYLNRAGIPILEEHAPGPQWARSAGHISETATCVSGEDKWGSRWPGCDYTLDVTGGWYDAGDYGKYVVNGGIAVWTLQHAAERLRRDGTANWGDGRLNIPESSNGVSDILDEARAGLEFLMSMQVPDGKDVAVAPGGQETDKPLSTMVIDAGGLVHHKVHERKWLPLPLLPEKAEETRYLMPPSTAATLNLAASAAQCARLWRGLDDAFSERCLTAAKRAYGAAKRHPNLQAYNNFDGGGPYDDSDLSDEFGWAATELYATTGDASYMAGLSKTPGRAWLASNGQGTLRDIYWGNVDVLPLMTMQVATDAYSARDRDRAALALTAIARRYLYDAPFPADGYVWGSNGALAGRGMILASAYEATGEEAFRNGAVAAMDVILGRNPLAQSYVSGYGVNAMRFPHHRFWAAGADKSYPEGAPGALSGGPGSTTTGPIR
jgi:endoglucanase